MNHADIVERLKTELLDWIDGRRSHTNDFYAVEGDTPRAQTLVWIAQADAAEVVKLSAAIVALESDAK